MEGRTSLVAGEMGGDASQDIGGRPWDLGTFLAVGDFFHERRREKCVVSDPVE